MCEFIKINVKDDVVVLLEDSKMGDTIKVDDKEIQILQDTPKGHKIAIKNIDRDNEVLEYKFESKKLENTVKENDIYFKGYVRENGDIGIRNEIWIVNTVGCINKTCAILAREGNKLINDKIDGVHHFEHPHGCSQLGDDL
ncbi:UxaA family hydrolase, partial [Romboutsia ilealis]|uniref:UxaA family hydrolase n=1 Tax=Romboutsia ilealis TaxID=1115758 RepID=UPI002573F454